MRSKQCKPRTVLFAGLVTALAALPCAGRAQIGYDSPAGRVEVLGLKRWTLKMLQDSIRHYIPGQELHSAACMVTLRDSLHFADAEVVTTSSAQPGHARVTFLVIKVVEPQDSARVRWDQTERNDFTSLRPEYAPLVLPATDTAGMFLRNRILQWLQYYPRDSAARTSALAHAPESARTDAHRLWEFLDDHRSEADRVRAMRILKRDGFYVNRFVASAVLANFSFNDSTWRALAHALRDPHEVVRGGAAMVLANMPSRPIDWKPVTADIRLLMGGTNLGAMQGVFELLDRTAISPDLVSALLHDNADWLLTTLGAEYPFGSSAAHSLLVRFNRGVDLGTTRAAWAHWASTL